MIKKKVRAATAVEAAAARKSQGRAEAAADRVAVAEAGEVLPPEVAAAAAPKSTVGPCRVPSPCGFLQYSPLRYSPTSKSLSLATVFW